MAHYSFIDNNNIVVEVIVGRDEDETVQGISDWEAYYATKRQGLRCLRTSYNTRAGKHIYGGEPFRGNYAGKGFSYREDLDAFIAPQPYPSWVLDELNFIWRAPKEMPNDGLDYLWNEEVGDWVVGE